MKKIRGLYSWIVIMTLFLSLLTPVSADNTVFLESTDKFGVYSDALTTRVDTNTFYLTKSGTARTGIFFITYDLSSVDFDALTGAVLGLAGYWDHRGAGVNVYEVTTLWNSTDGTFAYNEAPISTIATLSSARGDYFNVTDFLKSKKGSDSVTFMLQSATSSSKSNFINQTKTYYPEYHSCQIKLSYETSPIANNLEISGAIAVGTLCKAEYIYSGERNEGETEFQWYLADDNTGTNQTVITGEVSKSLSLTPAMQDKYICVKITPHAESGLFAKGGAGVCNTYYSAYVGPVKSKDYLDNIVLGMHDLTRSELETYINSYVVELDVSLDTDEIEMLLDELLVQRPNTYNEFNYIVNVVTTLKRIKTSSASEVKTIIEDNTISLNLDTYFLVTNKDNIYSGIAGGIFDSVSELQVEINRLCIYEIIKSTTSEKAICNALNINKSIFSTDLSDFSYGKLHSVSVFLLNNKTNYNNFSDINLDIPNAIVYANKNYNGGFVNFKQDFSEAAYFKVDFSENSYGTITSASLSSGRYKLMGEKSDKNAKYYTILKLDLNELPEYEIYSADINLYGTVGGGQNKILSVAKTGSFADQTDFMSKYVEGKDIVIGDTICSVQYSYGTTEWKKASITDAVKTARNDGERYIYLILNYENAAGADESKAGFLYPINNAEYAPYVEFVFETPALVKNVELNGVRAVGSTLSVSYDYYGCFEEGDSIIEWFAADDTLGTNENKLSFVGNNLLLTSDLAGKFIAARVIPKSKGGQYSQGEVSQSEYSLPIQNELYVNTVIENLNSCTTETELDAVLSDSTLSLDLSFGGVTGISNIKNAILNKTFSSLDELTDYLDEMIDVQKINETTVDSDIEKIVEKNAFDLNLSRYSTMSSAYKSTIINSLKSKNFLNVETFVDAFNDACITTEFADVNYSNINELLSFYDFLLDADYSSLTDSKKTIVNNSFMTYLNSGTGYGTNTKSLINNTLNSAVAYLSTYVPSINPSSGGSGGSSGSAISISMPPSSGSAVVGSVGGFTPVKNEYVFNDIESVANWAGDQITTLYNKKIISGDGDGGFRPNDSVKREEFVKMIVSAFRLTFDGECDFSDAEKDAWYYKYICVAYNNGITSGMGNGTFGVGSDITREDMVVMLYRILMESGYIKDQDSNSYFADAYEISSYARKAVTTFSNYKIVSGIGDNLFSPKGTATRAMAAVMISNAMAVAGIE